MSARVPVEHAVLLDIVLMRLNVDASTWLGARIREGLESEGVLPRR